jgi:hypothetical protein
MNSIVGSFLVVDKGEKKGSATENIFPYFRESKHDSYNSTRKIIGHVILWFFKNMEKVHHKEFPTI